MVRCLPHGKHYSQLSFLDWVGGPNHAAFVYGLLFVALTHLRSVGFRIPSNEN